MQRSVIAVVGETGSGKTLITDTIRPYGYVYASGGNILREISRRSGLPIDRNSLISLGNDLRELFGPEILMRAAVLQLEQSGQTKWVFESIRNPAEVKFLKENYTAFVLGVRMDDDKRFFAMQLRGREGDPKTIEEFDVLKKREAGEGEPSWGIDVAGCMELADVIIENNPSLSESVLQAEVVRVLHERVFTEGFKSRPELR